MHSHGAIRSTSTSLADGSVDVRAIIGVIAGLLSITALLVAGIWYLQSKLFRRTSKRVHNYQVAGSMNHDMGNAAAEDIPPPRYESVYPNGRQV